MLENPKSKVYQDDSWKAYKTLNERFADTIAEMYQPGDTSKSNIWNFMLACLHYLVELGPDLCVPISLGQ